ncbi:hypothetical protein HHK36_005754 [Tetracentron sinense]|uniref:Exopolygalacturonase-like n=1 Tax=Tetracentron sinense TaxID=13715 RepID=A0A834ZQ22_TETSI|nr:hypothetical protein HHK36_005754 [Tetracentron sinense]
MGSKSILGAICLLLFLASFAKATQVEGVFNVRRYGAKADGLSDISQAILSAWKEACASATPSRLLIPKGTYATGPVKFQGPCKAPVGILVKGILKAPTDLNKFKSEDGWIVFQNIDRLTLSGGGIFDGQGASAWAQNDCAKTGKCNSLPINMRFNFITNSIVRDITSLNSKLFHINILGCKNLNLEHIIITAPENSLNTDGIHIGSSTGINIIDSVIGTGDDCVSLGPGSHDITVTKVTCGPGHGISVGSLGKYPNEEDVVGITVRNCTLTNTMNGVRIKTWPASPTGIATDMHFEDIIMNNVGNPVLLDQEYCPYNQCNLQIPSRIKISKVSFKNIQGTSASQIAVKLVCSRDEPCQNVEVGDINLRYTGKEGPAKSQCANVKPILSGKQNPPISFS